MMVFQMWSHVSDTDSVFYSIFLTCSVSLLLHLNASVCSCITDPAAETAVMKGLNSTAEGIFGFSCLLQSYDDPKTNEVFYQFYFSSCCVKMFHVKHI